MGFGSTAKKLQNVADMAEKLYGRVEELRESVRATRDTVEDTNDRVAGLEEELRAQRELLEALAADAGVTVEESEADQPAQQEQGP